MRKTEPYMDAREFMAPGMIGPASWIVKDHGRDAAAALPGLDRRVRRGVV